MILRYKSVILIICMWFFKCKITRINFINIVFHVFYVYALKSTDLHGIFNSVSNTRSTRIESGQVPSVWFAKVYESETIDLIQVHHNRK